MTVISVKIVTVMKKPTLVTVGDGFAYQNKDFQKQQKKNVHKQCASLGKDGTPCIGGTRAPALQ